MGHESDIPKNPNLGPNSGMFDASNPFSPQPTHEIRPPEFKTDESQTPTKRRGPSSTNRGPRLGSRRQRTRSHLSAKADSSDGDQIDTGDQTTWQKAADQPHAQSGGGNDRNDPPHTGFLHPEDDGSKDFKFIPPPPFDGSQTVIPKSEKIEGTREFKTRMDSIFASHPRDIIENGPVRDKTLTQQLNLQLATVDGPLRIQLSRDRDNSSVPFTTYQLIVEFEYPRLVENEADGPQYQYKMTRGGEVLRSDSNILGYMSRFIDTDMELNRTQRIEPEQAIDMLMRRIQSDKLNFELEQQLGLNNQPIGLTELSYILGVVEMAQAKPIAFVDLDEEHTVSNSFDEIDLPPYEIQLQSAVFSDGVDSVFSTYPKQVEVNINPDTHSVSDSLYFTGQDGVHTVNLNRVSTPGQETERRVIITKQFAVDSISLEYHMTPNGLLSTRIQNDEIANASLESTVTMDYYGAQILRKFLRQL